MKVFSLEDKVRRREFGPTTNKAVLYFVNVSNGKDLRLPYAFRLNVQRVPFSILYMHR
jgi:hypothetical protein